MTPTLPPPVITDISQLDPNGSYTYADYLRWQFTETVELIRGKIMRKMAGAAKRHQRVSMNLSWRLAAYLDDKTCQVFAAPFDVRLLRSTGNGDTQIRTVVQPDLLVVCDPAKLDEGGCLGAPDWVIEIVSPGTATRDTHTKFDLYAENGVAEYWIVFPSDQNVAAYVLRDGEYQLTDEYYEPGRIPSHTLPDLHLEWAAVFAGV